MEIGTKVLERRISNSSLDWIRLGPRVFKMMWDRELVKTSTTSLDLGSAVHCYILEPERFKEDYVVLDASVKPVGGLMGEFIRAVNAFQISLLPGDELTNEDYQNIANAVGFKLKLTQILEDYQKPKYDAYKTSLREAHGKQVISVEDMNTIQAIQQAIISHKLANKLMYGTEDWDVVEAESRQDGVVHGKYKSINAIGIIDRLLINHKTKEIVIVDLKTTGDSVYLFNSSYNKYQYDRQMAFYYDMLKDQYPDYDIEVYMVVVQTTYATHTTDCAVYNIDDLELEKGRIKYKLLLDKVSWHMSKDIWDYPQEYYESNGLCLLNQSRQ